MPEDSYHGEDIINHAKAFAEIHGDSYVEKSEEERRKALAKEEEELLSSFKDVIITEDRPKDFYYQLLNI